MNNASDNTLGGIAVAVVIPCYHSEKTVGTLSERLVQVLSELGGRFQLIFVDDASRDGTWQALVQVKKRYGDVIRCIRLARNVGQHSALMCGMGALNEGIKQVITMDDDLQHRPEDIPRLLEALVVCDIAIGAYTRKHHVSWRNFGGALVDAVLRHLFNLPKNFQLTSFRAMRRFVADEVSEQDPSYIYITSAILSASNRVINVPVEHEARKIGSSNYRLSKSLILTANLLLTYSRLPLFLVSGICVGSLAFTMFVTFAIILMKLLTDWIIPGWASLMVMIGIQSTLLMSAIALLMIYVARSHRLLNRAPTKYRIADVI